MPWREVSVMEQRREFVGLAMQEGANRRELCRRFGISPETGYKWLGRWNAGDQALADRSRRPHVSPLRSAAEIEALTLALRDAHPMWGARKLVRCLERDGHAAPAVSTVHAILVRHGRVPPPAGTPGQPYRRFEKEAPNLLWQMDFKGRMPLVDGTVCHPLTAIDDHSRYALCLSACLDERSSTVQERLEATFRRYGLPDAIFVDNGSPWGDPAGERWTRLGVWLLKLGVAVLHSRPYHPQSRGKNERFHRTMKAERCSPSNGSTISLQSSARSIAGAPSTTSNARTKRSARSRRQAAIDRAPEPCPSECRGSNTMSMRSCAPFQPPRLTSASRDACGRSRKPFAESVSPSGR